MRCLLLSSLIILVLAITICAEEYCYWKDPQKYYYFGAKTSYEANHGDLNSVEIPDKCEAIRFWSLNRHGTRYSVKISVKSATVLSNFLKDIVYNYENSQSHLCKEDIELLKAWDNSVIVGLEDQLNPAGYEELKHIAERFKDKFPEILNSNYSDKYFYFQHTDGLTTKQSFSGYAEGLFGKDSQATAVESNRVIRADDYHENYYFSKTNQQQFKMCDGWDQLMSETNIKAQQKLFKKQPEFQNVIRSVSNRLGFKETVNESTILIAYDFCRFKKAWNFSKISPWCSLFTEEQLKVMEYWEDLRYYYKSGYGQEINPKLGCVLVKDFYTMFENAIIRDASSHTTIHPFASMVTPWIDDLFDKVYIHSLIDMIKVLYSFVSAQLIETNDQNVQEPKVTVYFSHSVPLIQTYTALDLFHDKIPLTYDNYKLQSNRQFRISVIDSFGSNIAAVLYKCREGETYRVQFLRNERPLNFDGCADGLCSWPAVKRKFFSVADACSLDICKVQSQNSTTESSAYVFHFNAVTMIFCLFYLSLMTNP